MSTKLQGKVALITGGSTGIGLATAKRFADEGAYVYITGRRQAELDAAVRHIGKNAVAVQSDVSKLPDLDKLYAKIKQQHAHIDILFANAGVAEFVPFEAITEAHYDKLFNINVKGLVFTIHKALPLLADGASVILNASVAGVKGVAAASVYSATKAAVRSLARTLTTDLKARKIRVNVISPGPIETPIFDTIGIPAEQLTEVKSGFVSQVPLGRMGHADEIAAAALFLGSAESSFVTGVDLFVDGGLAQV